MNKYTVNEVIVGCVTGIEKYGIFLSFDEYYTGLIHISEISSDYVKNIADYVHLGETIRVKVLEVDDQNNQLKLSIKDIEYKKMKVNRYKIIETSTGFEDLQRQLPLWVSQKESDILIK